MRYINQLEYESIPYPTDLEHPDSEFATHGNIRRAGCGLCSACMVVERLRGIQLSVTECRDISVEVGANHAIGTDMKLLAPEIAKRYRLELETTNDPAQLTRCLHQGGAAIVNVGGDREGHTGTFSNGGHYIVAIREKGGLFYILDPSWTPEKYQSSPRRERVREVGKLLLAEESVLQEDTANRSPGYYLFSLKESQETPDVTGQHGKE